MTNLILSIGIPTYNGGEQLVSLIKGILLSSEKRVEVVVCDNCSTDDTVCKVNKITDNRLRVVTHKTNVGPFKNWWDALISGNGKYVMLVQDNDMFFVENLSTYINFLAAHNYDIIRNVDSTTVEGEVTVAQMQFYGKLYSHAGYLTYLRKALLEINPLKFSFNYRYCCYPHCIWDAQILKKYSLNEKKAYFNNNIKIVRPVSVKNKSRTKNFYESIIPPSYSFDWAKYMYEKSAKILKVLYKDEEEYSKILVQLYRGDLFLATINFYVIMNSQSQYWMKRRYGLDRLKGEDLNYIKLHYKFFQNALLYLKIKSPKVRVLTIIKLQIITQYNKYDFLLNYNQVGNALKMGYWKIMKKKLKLLIDRV